MRRGFFLPNFSYLLLQNCFLLFPEVVQPHLPIERIPMDPVKTPVAEAPKPLHEEVLVAILHRAQKAELPTSLIESTVLELSVDLRGEPWYYFRAGPRKHSEVFSKCISALVHGGSVIRKMGTGFLCVSQHTLGPFGEKLYNGFPPELQRQVDTVANRLSADAPA